MKALSYIAAVALICFTAASCGVLGNNTASSQAASTTASASGTVDGQAAGVALKSLYGQYKADGKLDMSNLSNIINLASLAQNIKGLKGLTDKSAFYTEFASGLILGSDNLVTEKNTTSVMSGLTGLINNIDLSGLQEKATEAKETVSDKVESAAQTTTTVVNNATAIADSVTNILSLFKK